MTRVIAKLVSTCPPPRPAGLRRFAERRASANLVRICLLLICLIAAGCSDRQFERRTYVLTTGTTGGTFYPVGVALSTIVSARQDQSFSLTAISSAGSMENIKLLRDNQAQFGLILGVFAAWAWEGAGPIGTPQSHMRAVGATWPNVEHFVLSTDLVSSGTLDDLADIDGERFVLGMRNSGAEQTGAYILDALGIDFRNRFSLAYMGYGAVAGAIQDGNISGMNVPAGAPVAAITQSFAQMRESITLLNFTQQHLDAINRNLPLWNFYDLPAGTYPYQPADVTTAFSPNVLVTREDVPEEIVYQLTRLMWESLPALREIHSATREMILERALSGIVLPLHPGALRYYEEAGLEISAELRPAVVNTIK